MPNFTPDEIDRSILMTLQKDGRLSNVQLAQRVNLSESACLRRVKMLEKSGVIDRYVMLVNQAASGKPDNVFIQITLDRQKQEDFQHFENAIPGDSRGYGMLPDDGYLGLSGACGCS